MPPNLDNFFIHFEEINNFRELFNITYRTIERNLFGYESEKFPNRVFAAVNEMSMKSTQLYETRPSSDTLGPWKLYARTLEQAWLTGILRLQSLVNNTGYSLASNPNLGTRNHNVCTLATLVTLKHVYPNLVKETKDIFRGKTNMEAMDTLLEILPTLYGIHPDVEQCMREYPFQFLHFLQTSYDGNTKNILKLCGEYLKEKILGNLKLFVYDQVDQGTKRLRSSNVLEVD